MLAARYAFSDLYWNIIVEKTKSLSWLVKPFDIFDTRKFEYRISIFFNIFSISISQQPRKGGGGAVSAPVEHKVQFYATTR